MSLSAGPSVADASELRLCIEATALQEQVARFVDAGRHLEALHAIAMGVDVIYKRPDLLGHGLYLFGLDRLLHRLGQELRGPDWHRAPVAGAELLILSEFYQFGGHSRVAEDLVDTLGGAVVVVTDLFDAYDSGRQNFDSVAARMPKALTHRLREKNLLGKVRELQQVLRSVRPSRVFVLAHHPDPVPFVAAADLPPTVRKVFIHHCDHQPALGNSLPGYAHVDLSQHLQRICARNLGRPNSYLPLYVPDSGPRTFGPALRPSFGVVTSGSSAKYLREGPLAYRSVVVEVLQTVGGRFWHIGSLDADWLQGVQQALAEAGIPGERFCYVPHVPSLWGALRELDAHVFLGSFPIGGGRAAIEAQGCGLPVLFYTSPERPPLLQNEDVFAQRALGWSTRQQLRAALETALADHAACSAAARAHYERHYSRQAFEQGLAAIGEDRQCDE